jgi:hypothetical protein
MPTDTFKRPRDGVSGFLSIEGAPLVVFGLAALVFAAIAGGAAAVLLGWILIARGLVGLAVGVIIGVGLGLSGMALQQVPDKHLMWGS